MAILELVTFKLAKGISDEVSLVENALLHHWLKSQLERYGSLARYDEDYQYGKC